MEDLSMAGNREQQMYEITKQLEEGVKELFTSERYAEYLKTMSKFYNYSFNNTVLIALQRPEATLVAGYSAWQKNFHRQVKRGEKGIQIIAPSQRKEKEVVEKFDPETNEPILGPDGQPETEVVEHVVSDFRVVRVFDVSQTYGEPLPELAIQDLTEQVQNYPLFLQAVRELSPVPIRFDETEGEAKGYYNNKKKEIVVKEDMSESQTIKTLIHEIAHAKLHDREVLEQAGEEKDQRTKEIEAESIAYTVCQYFGLDTSDYSFPYIASWSDNLKMWELRSFMDAIRKTAGEFIKELEGKMKELETDRDERDSIQNEKEIKIGMDTQVVGLEQHEGLWHTVEEVEIEKEHFYLMEHNEYGASVAPVLVNENGRVVAQDLENGLDQEAMKAIREYLEEKEIDKKQDKGEFLNASLFEEAKREAAYQIETTGHFFFIQETEEGYDYTFYNQEFQELDGGVYDTFDVTLQEAAKALLLEEGENLAACRKIDSEMLQEQVERAEYFPQKSYEALKPLMESEENNIAFRSGYGYVMLQKISEGYEYIIYDQAFREIGGQFYENITASKEEVVSWIFREEGMGELPCEPFSYEELKKSVIEGEKQRLYEGELTPTSQIDIREEELLHGESRQNIEESVLCYAQAELEEAGYEEITLLAARVYGSRTRENLYREDSDLDVVLSYTGDIREDVFFNLLQENGMRIAGLKIDVNPISLEKTGTLQEYMKRAEQYLDEREAEKQGRTPQETVQEPKISFYAAECMEFPSMGEYYENLTLEEAVEKYKTIPEDRIHGIKGIGFCLEDGSIYDGEYELMSGGKISKDLIDLVPHYKESPLVQKAMRDLERILAEKQRENTAEQAKPEGTMGRKVSVLKALKERKELLKKQEKKEETSHTRKKEAEL